MPKLTKQSKKDSSNRQVQAMVSKHIKIDQDKGKYFDVYIRGKYKTICAREICDILNGFYAVGSDTTRVTFPDDKKAIVSTEHYNLQNIHFPRATDRQIREMISDCAKRLYDIEQEFRQRDIL